MFPKYDFGVDEVPDHKEIIYMKEILIVADYVPSFGGSYIQSSTLQLLRRLGS